jgi:hypothetical protein
MDSALSGAHNCRLPVAAPVLAAKHQRAARAEAAAGRAPEHAQHEIHTAGAASSVKFCPYLLPNTSALHVLKQLLVALPNMLSMNFTLLGAASSVKFCPYLLPNTSALHVLKQLLAALPHMLSMKFTLLVPPAV